MRLLDLDPQWVADFELANRSHRRGEDIRLETAQGLIFDCPKCAAAQGSHSILAWFRGRGVPDDALPGPGRWTVESGTGFADLTLLPSILLTSGCGWHGFVRGGEVVDA